ncbi:MAG: sigma-70 family RNA polymerase sigma factor [Arcicella sp.]|nr:sigma-70 family RNA polymerase sigma factor [Arcicella sp.]
MTTEKDIITDLKGENDNAFGELYKKYFPTVQRFILNNKGTKADADDIFQDTMLILLEKLRQERFTISASMKTYIMAIAKHLWLNKIRTSYRDVELTENHFNRLLDDIDVSIEQEKTYQDKLQGYLHKITEHCKGLIHNMFFKDSSIEQIQEQYGYSSRHNAINQKHKCIEQIRRVKLQDEKR